MIDPKTISNKRIHELNKGRKLSKNEQIKKDKKTIIWIVIFGLFLLYAFNWNVYLVFKGDKMLAEVQKVYTEVGDDGINKYMDIEFYRKSSRVKSYKNRISITGPRLIFSINEGDQLTIYGSTNYPNNIFIPYHNLILALFIFIFFVMSPLFFLIYGKVG